MIMMQSDLESIRSFIAVELPPRVKSGLLEARNIFDALDRHVRWVRPEGMHLTLKFLGNIEPKQVDPVSARIEEAVNEMGPFQVTVQGAGVFPNLRNPRVLWVGLTEGQEYLSTIYKNLQKGLKREGFKPESRPYRPHLTLGRFRDGRKAGGILDEGLLESAAHLKESFTVDRINLIRSQLNPSGAVYTLLSEHPLIGSPTEA